MSSSLAAQLAKNASLNASLLSTTRKPTESYLFPASQAATHDLESIHFLASNAFLQLKSVQPSSRKYEAALFSDAVKDVDRTLLSEERNEELDGNLQGFLRLLGPWLMEGMVGKILEWLVRRFRINEFNVEDVLVLFLPYHDSPHFAKMLSILHIKPQSRFSFLLPFRSAAKHLPRTALVSSMVQDTDLARFVSSLLPNAHQDGYSHRALLAFNIGVMHEYIVRCKILDEAIVVFVVSALVEVLKGGSDGNVVLGSYVLLSTLSQKGHLASKATKAIVGAMVESAPRVSTGQFMKAVVAVCEPQDQVDDFGNVVVGKVLKLSNIHEEIHNAFIWAGFEKFVFPLLKGLVSRLPEEMALTTTQSILTSSNVPDIIIRHLSMLLVEAVVASGDTIDITPHRAMLTTIQQHYSPILQEVAEEVISEEEDVKDAVEQLIISLSMVYSKEPRNKANADMVVASTSAEQNVRVIAVNALLRTLSDKKSIEAPDLTSIHSALLARAHDTKAPVIQALYSQPSSILPILSASAESYIAAITQTLSNDPSRALIRAHLSFLASHFYIANPGLASVIFDKCFFRFLLFSKSRKETAKATWEIIEDANDRIGTYEVIQGCADDWKWHTDRPGGESIDVMAKANMAIAARMAENILSSDGYAQHLTSLLDNMQDADPHMSAMAHLVARALLGRLSGERQIDSAGRMLDAMHLEILDGTEDIHDGDKDGEMLVDDRGLGLKIVQKPAGRKTIYWLKFSIFALLPLIARPTGAVLDWFADSPSNTADTRGTQYLSLMRAVYKFANTSASLPMLTTNIIRALFLNLKEDSLVFLTSIVVRSYEVEEDKATCVAALRHAGSFLAAQPSVDFQTILPSLIVAISGADVGIRAAAVDCVTTMASDNKDLNAVYGFDTVYGKHSGNLQYLDFADVLNYVRSVVEFKDLIAQDGNYFKIFQQQHLARDKSDSKAVAKYKKRILSYLLSHVSSIGLPSAQTALLKTMSNISDEVKAQALLPVIQDLVQHSLVDQCGSLEEYATVVVSSFDKSSSESLNETNSASWPVFISVLRHFFQLGSLQAPRAALGRNLEHGLFAALSSHRQIETCTVLLQIGGHIANALSCKKVLGNIIREASLMQHLLMRLQPTTSQVISPVKKRPKLDEPASNAPSADFFPSLVLLAEILAASSLPGSLDLISRLLDTLNSVLHYEPPAQGDKSYVEQLLMSAIENAAQNVIEIPNLSPSAIRLDILVELIRVSDNTQTTHQALLLMASLTRLTPESVLHNVMPVFTFMGSNVFHRDDSYSFKVVQQTVNSIVPVMVSSLKTKLPNKMNLYTGSRDFLRIFTDAANHIPRHRRTNFFSHLVDVLGPEDFLAPVCMLLIDKVANRVIRQNADEVQGSLALPLSIMQHYPNPVQISALTELLRESQRLTSHVLDPKEIAPTFLDLPRDEEHSLPLSSVLKRRAQALIIFIGHALQTSSSTKHRGDSPTGEAISDLVSLLVHMATLPGGSTPESNIDYISKAAQSTMSLSLGAIPATDFISAVLTTLESNEERIQSGSLDILSSRLHNVTDTVRRIATTTINNIVDLIRKIISSTLVEGLMISALMALRTISLTMCPGEESSLVNAIPSVLAAIQGRKALAAAMTTLPPMVLALGPRIIPVFRDIIDKCVSVISEGPENQTESPTIEENALTVLHGMLVSIPAFWGSEELMKVIRLYTDHYSSKNTRPTASTSLMNTVSKRAPAKVLLPTLCDMWSSIEASPRVNRDRIITYFDLLKTSLRSASRPMVLENLRPLFKTFIEAFGVPSKLTAVDAAQVEVHSIPAFIELVVKLNEAAFRPLFRKLYDWAFANENDTSDARKISFCHIYSSLLDYFKGLMSTYMSFLLQPFTELLRTYTISSTHDKMLWLGIVETLTKSFNSDEGAFWRNDKLRRIAPLLVEQVSICIQLELPEGRVKLSGCLDALMEVVNDDALIKSINLDLLMHTRSEDVRSRVFALTCSESLWRAHGEKLLGFVAETATLIAECAEDDNDLVVKEAHRLKNAVENVAGKISGL